MDLLNYFVDLSDGKVLDVTESFPELKDSKLIYVTKPDFTEEYGSIVIKSEYDQLNCIIDICKLCKPGGYIYLEVTSDKNLNLVINELTSMRVNITLMKIYGENSEDKVIIRAIYKKFDYTIHAIYGTEERGLDVGNKVIQFIRGKELFFPAGFKFNDVFGDPHPFREKNLKIIINGKDVYEVPENLSSDYVILLERQPELETDLPRLESVDELESKSNSLIHLYQRIPKAEMYRNERFGFIMATSVRSKGQLDMLLEVILILRASYANKLVIIDDNSTIDLNSAIAAGFEEMNISIIKSEHPGAGELLPYYYLYKERFFDEAVIIHDGTVIQDKVNFKNISSIKFLWNFGKPHLVESFRLDTCLNLISKLNHHNELRNLYLSEKDWFGCFGVQSHITLDYLDHIQEKYNFFAILDIVKNRDDRSCVERVLPLMVFHDLKDVVSKDVSESYFGDAVEYMDFITNNICHWMKFNLKEYHENLQKVQHLKALKLFNLR